MLYIHNTMYRLRIDKPETGLDVDALIQVCEPTSYVVVHHQLPHGNPHYHLYIKTDIKDNTLRLRIKRKFNIQKASDYSLKTCNPNMINEYVQYMFNTKHGNVWELIDTLNFDNELLNTLIDNAKQISTDYEAVSDKKKSSKPTIYDLAMEVRERFKEKHHITDNPTEQLGYSPSPEGSEEYLEHLKIGISVCRKYHQPFEEHYLRRLITTAICEGASGRQTIISKIMNKEFPS